MSAKYILPMLALLISGSAQADCEYLAKGIKQKIQNFEAFRTRNEATLATLMKTETSCQERGAQVSGKIAGLADALSCQAQLDASHIDKEMGDLGEKCEGNFQQIHEIQTLMRTTFQSVKADLEEGNDYMNKSEILREFCANEIKEAKSLVENFDMLETSIVVVEGRSVNGEISYGKFKDTAKSLQAATTGRNTNCGELASAALTAFKAPAQGASVKPVPAGTSPNAASDITGTAKDELASGTGVPNVARPGAPRPRPEWKIAEGSAESGVTGASPSAPKAQRKADAISTVTEAFSRRLDAPSQAPSQSGRDSGGSAPSVGAALWSDDGAKLALSTGAEATAASPAADGKKAVVFLGEVTGTDSASLSASSTSTPAPADSVAEAAAAADAATDAASAVSLFSRVKHAYQTSEQFRSARAATVAQQ